MENSTEQEVLNKIKGLSLPEMYELQNRLLSNHCLNAGITHEWVAAAIKHVADLCKLAGNGQKIDRTQWAAAADEATSAARRASSAALSIHLKLARRYYYDVRDVKTLKTETHCALEALKIFSYAADAAWLAAGSKLICRCESEDDVAKNAARAALRAVKKSVTNYGNEHRLAAFVSAFFAAKIAGAEAAEGVQKVGSMGSIRHDAWRAATHAEQAMPDPDAVAALAESKARNAAWAIIREVISA